MPTIRIIETNIRKIFKENQFLKETDAEGYINLFKDIILNNLSFIYERTSDKKQYIFESKKNSHILPHKLYFLKNGEIILIPNVEAAIIGKRIDKSSSQEKHKIRVGINLQTGSLVVVKRYLNSREKILSELIARNKLACKSLISVIGIHESKNKLIESFCAMDLFDLIHKKKLPLSEIDLINAARSLLEGLDILHKGYEMDHHDIKPENIFVNRSEEDGNWHFYLGDFDLSLPRNERHSHFKGSFDFAPPEYHLELNADKKDVFSLGMSLIELLEYENVDFVPPMKPTATKNLYFRDLFKNREKSSLERSMEIAKKFLDEKIGHLKKRYENLPNTLELISIIEKMIAPDSKQRLSVQEALERVRALNPTI